MEYRYGKEKKKKRRKKKEKREEKYHHKIRFKCLISLFFHLSLSYIYIYIRSPMGAEHSGEGTVGRRLRNVKLSGRICGQEVWNLV